MARSEKPLSEEAAAEIERFSAEIKNLVEDRLDQDDFKKFRLNNGVYGIRMSPNHMVRIKVPYGCFTADQLEAVTEAAERYTPARLAHVTTRQSIQIHNVKRDDVPAVLRLVNEAGLTTREACGNTVRNISCDPLAGIAPDELFDPRPCADLVLRYLLRNPLCQNLPRKFKIVFEGCPASDRARIGIHDLGFRAAVREAGGVATRGFVTTVGGGLGPIPFAAQLLEEFTPVGGLLATIEAVIRLFDRNGERRDKNRARIKFLIAKWGIEEFRRAFREERRVALLTSSGRIARFKIERAEETPPPAAPFEPDGTALPGFEKWSRTNVIPQKQQGFSAVFVRCYLGDVDPAQARGIAAIARDFSGGRIRTAITQNLVVPWVPTHALRAVYRRLSEIGMGLAHAQEIADITRCPGADTCNLAITHSKGLARHLTQRVFSNGAAGDPVFKDIAIKISGCVNSCGQHHIADLGFFGASRNIDGRSVPHYQFLLGGRTGPSTSDVKFGERVAFIPARRVHEAVSRVLGLFKSDRRPEETFAAWTDRKGIEFFRAETARFQDIDAIRGDPESFEDLGDEGRAFKVEVGKGECAA